MTIQDMIDILQAYKSGKKIQYKTRFGPWKDIDVPAWNFTRYEYRIKPEPRVRWIVESEDGWSVHDAEYKAETRARTLFNYGYHSIEVYRVVES